MPDTRDEDMERVRQHVTALSEHFDSVQVFCTRCEEGTLGGTVNIQLGAGNYFSRYGLVNAWLVKQNEGYRIDERRAAKEDDQ